MHGLAGSHCRHGLAARRLRLQGKFPHQCRAVVFFFLFRNKDVVSNADFFVSPDDALLAFGYKP